VHLMIQDTDSIDEQSGLIEGQIPDVSIVLTCAVLFFWFRALNRVDGTLFRFVSYLHDRINGMKDKSSISATRYDKPTIFHWGVQSLSWCCLQPRR
jgi:hypothetical protein